MLPFNETSNSGASEFPRVPVQVCIEASVHSLPAFAKDDARHLAARCGVHQLPSLPRRQPPTPTAQHPLPTAAAATATAAATAAQPTPAPPPPTPFPGAGPARLRHVRQHVHLGLRRRL